MDNIELGGNINLVGFKDIEPQKLVVIKKLVGNFVKRLQNHYKEDFNSIVIDLKKIHISESEIFAKLTISNTNPVDKDFGSTIPVWCTGQIIIPTVRFFGEHASE